MKVYAPRNLHKSIKFDYFSLPNQKRSPPVIYSESVNVVFCLGHFSCLVKVISIRRGAFKILNRLL